MGYIKKLKSNELVGGTDKVTIYPVTSTKAVFEEVTEGDKSSFKSQETINGEHDDRIKGLENEMPVTVKSITINGGTKTYLPEDGNVELTIYSEGGEDYPGIAEAVQNNADNITAIQNEIGTDTTEDTLSGRIKSLENAVGTGGSVDQRISNAIGNINAEHSDMDPTDHIQYQIVQSNGEITDLTIQGVDIASANALEALRQTYENLSRTNIIIQDTIPTTGDEGVIYRVTGETTYTDYMFYNDQRYTMATYDIGNLDPQVSYYTCATLAATPAKTATGTDASAYALTLGGHFKVEMDEANTATSGVTLQVGSAAAKELMYNGATVNAENTWEAGEVIAVYYYNNKYWASNAQGGGGKAEKIKYDNSQSGLAAENVQGALDEVGEETSSVMDALGMKEIMQVCTMSSQNAISTYTYPIHAGDKFIVKPSIGSGVSYVNAVTRSNDTTVEYILNRATTDDEIIFVSTQDADSFGFYSSGGRSSVLISKISSDISVDEVPTLGSSKVVSSDGVAGYVINSSAFKGAALSANVQGIIFGNTWSYATDRFHKVLETDGNTLIKVTANSVESAGISFLKTYVAPSQNGESIDWCDGYSSSITLPAGTTKLYEIPSDCNYIVFNSTYQARDFSPSSVSFPVTNQYVYDEVEDIKRNQDAVELKGSLINANAIISDGGDWYRNANDYYLGAWLDVSAYHGKTIRVIAQSSILAKISFVKSLPKPLLAGTSTSVSFATGWSGNVDIPAASYSDFVVPSDAYFMYIFRGGYPAPSHQEYLDYLPDSILLVSQPSLFVKNELEDKQATLKSLKCMPFGTIWTSEMAKASSQAAGEWNSSSGKTIETIYFPSLVRTRHANAPYKYFLYYSHDHEENGGNVGIKMIASDDLVNWTYMGRLFEASEAWGDTSIGIKETETPSVVWDDKRNRYVMIWQSKYDFENVERCQVSYVSTSEDGINWTYVKAANDKLRLSHIVGDGHDGYWTVYKRNGYFEANSLLGSGDDSFFGRYHSLDGLKWFFEGLQSCYLNSQFTVDGTDHTKDNELYLYTGFPFYIDGCHYRVCFQGVVASGPSAAAQKNLYAQKFSDDYVQPLSDSTLLYSPTDTSAGETQNIKGESGFVDDDGTLYYVYVCKLSNGQYNMNLVKLIYE